MKFYFRISSVYFNKNCVSKILLAFKTAKICIFQHGQESLYGSGYELFADMLIKLDPINPQVCARVSSAFSTWKRYDAARQSRMAAQMDRVLAHPNLSNDTREMLSRMRG